MRKLKTKSEPVQVWAPLFYKSPFSNFLLDLQRAYKEWQNEDRIWLMPDAKKVIRWKVKDNNLLFYEAIIPSEELNVITIYHLDEQSRIYPPFLSTSKNKNVIESGLYRKWLKEFPSFYEGSDSITIILPVVKNDKFSRYEEKELKIKPGSVMPITDVVLNNNTFTMRWPPPDKNMLSTISPDIESKNFYGQLKFEKFKYRKDNEEKEIDVVLSEKEPGGKAINIWIKWPKPFEDFFPDGGNLDLIYHYAHMRNLIKAIESGDDERKKAFQELERLVGIFVSDAESTLEKTFYLPRVTKNRDALLADVEFRYGTYAENLDELMDSYEFKKLITQRVKIKRIYSWLGYLWWQLHHDISSNTNIKFCKNCGNIIRGGRSDRVYCTREENKECYNERLAQRQRKIYYKN